mgnify:CR=1 FL=1
MIAHHKPVQVAYFVNDIRVAATAMAASTGAGPFYVIDKIELAWAEHRHTACDFVHSSAYGQWGDIMVELVQQDSVGPSPFRDMYKAGEEGIHHVACFVDSLDDSIALYEQMGYPLASRAKAKLGTEFAFIDTRKLLGHMLEIYVADETLTGFYELIKQASIDWHGRNIFLNL